MAEKDEKSSSDSENFEECQEEEGEQSKKSVDRELLVELNTALSVKVDQLDPVVNLINSSDKNSSSAEQAPSFTSVTLSSPNSASPLPPPPHLSADDTTNSGYSEDKIEERFEVENNSDNLNVNNANNVINGSLTPPLSECSEFSASDFLASGGSNPNYEKIAKFYEKYSVQCAELERLEKQNSEYRDQLIKTIRERDNNEQLVKDVREQNLAKNQELERKVLECEYQLKATKDRMMAQDAHFRKSAHEFQTRFNAQIDQLKKTTERAEREKDEAVVRYATRESEILRLDGERQRAQDQLKQVTTERDALSARLRGSKSEKETTKSVVDQMESDLSDTRKQLESQQNFVKEAEIRVKLANKRVEDVEKSHEETKNQLESAKKQILRLQEENTAIREDHRKLITEFQMQDERKRKDLELRQNEVTEQESNYKEIMTKYDQLTRDYTRLQSDFEELRLNFDLQNAEKSKLEDEFLIEKTEHESDRMELKRLKDIETKVESSRTEARVAEKGKLEAVEEREQAERESGECRQQAERMLEITQQLTAKNSLLSSDNDALRSKNRDIETKLTNLEVELKTSTARLMEIETELDQIKACSSAEIESLKKQLDEKVRSEQMLATSVEDERNENRVLKKKHTASLKELRTELSSMKKRLAAYESGTASLGGHSDNTPGEQVSTSSRASSVTSLEAAGQRSSTDASSPVISNPALTHDSSNNSQPMNNNGTPPAQAMIEKIVKLQRQLARRSEKIEFLEEHVRQCVEELQKKTKIIQHYALREEAGSLLPDSPDLEKSLMAKKGVDAQTFFGSLFTAPSGDRKVSAELSMEINGRLQAVLEDTLVKNITLKENVDVLGQEISRLSRENRQLSLSVKK